MGTMSKLKFLINRFLRFLFKPLGNVYYAWNWFEKLFSLRDSAILTPDGFKFKMYSSDVMPLLKHEPYFHEALKGVLSRGSVFIDVGTYIGGFTIRASRIIGDRLGRSFRARFQKLLLSHTKHPHQQVWERGSPSKEVELSSHVQILSAKPSCKINYPRNVNVT